MTNPKKILRYIFFVLIAIGFFTLGKFTMKQILAASVSNFQQTINTGTLSVDIVDAVYSSVGSPSVSMGAVTFSFACQTATGAFGTTTQQIYVKNPDAADGGWNVSLAGNPATVVWDGAIADFDFNDPTTSGCTDGADTDNFGGQMTVNPSAVGSTIAEGACSSCTTTNVSKGTQASFSEGVTDTITILTGAAGSDDIGDWALQGVSISQKIPGEQPAASDYDINLTLTVATI